MASKVILVQGLSLVIPLVADMLVLIICQHNLEHNRTEHYYASITDKYLCSSYHKSYKSSYLAFLLANIASQCSKKYTFC